MDEERLEGGNTHAEIVRVGDTVRRPTGHWTPGVHALLRHLEARGYEGAPRVLGLDDQRRETLTHVPGAVVWPEHFALVRSETALAEVAVTIRRYHDAVADFEPPHDSSWAQNGSDPRGPAELVCHKDLAPWNLVHSVDGAWTFIDWDLAAPGRRSWDLSWALLSFVSLMPDSALTEAETVRRVAIFRESYGGDLFPDDVFEVAVERCEHESERIGRLGALGEQPYAKLLAEGHYEIWRSAAEHIRAHVLRWRGALTR